MKSARTVTVKDVAKAAGVSQAAVSMALRGSSEISAKRIEQIQAVARKLNYYPQAAGQLLRSKRKNQIGLIVAATDTDAMTHSGFQAPLLGVLAEICYKQQIAYQLELHHGDMASQSGLPHQIAANMVDGAILIGDVGQDVYAALDQRPDFPWVSINEPASYSVIMDIADVTEQLLEHIRSLGHSRVAYCGGPERYLEHRLALETFEKLSQQYGWSKHQSSDWIKLSDGVEDSTRITEIYHWAHQLFESPKRPTAVICHGDPMARTVAHAAAQNGLVVGRDVSITTWGSKFDAIKTWPIMTGVVYDHQQMAQAALTMLRQRMERPALVKPQKQVVKASLHMGQSVGPCPKT